MRRPKMEEMMAGFRLLAIVLMLAAFWQGANAGESKSKQVEVPEMQKALASSCNRFGFKLFQQVIGDSPKSDNIFISPLSVSYALAMTLNGADGPTRKAIRSTLELDDIDSSKVNSAFYDLASFLTGLDSLVKLDIANSIWYRQGLPVRPDFININRKDFGALVQGLDFASPTASEIINTWVNDNTNGKIKNIINPPIDPSTIMILINAIYFKGSWAIPFDPSSTRINPFYLDPNQETKCHMMFHTTRFDYSENDLFQAVSLSYGDRGFDMIVFLPRPEVAVDDLINRLDDQNWSIWSKSFINTRVELGLPRFKFAYEVIMNDMLKSLGMGIAFDDSEADFKKMLTPGRLADRNIFIDEVRHKTFLQVDEEGAEAAAVTSVTMALTEAAPMPIPEMIVNHPFLFAIRDRNSGSIIFMGKVSDPVWED